jgi:ATP-dependent Clp protease ATP-binding subunit ClpX
VLARTLKPSAIVRYLDQFVVGQEDAKKILAVAVYAHYRKIERGMVDDTGRVKSNVLLIGSSGTGKTLMCETLSRFLDVPFVTAEATSLANTRFVNEEIEAMLDPARREGGRRRRQGRDRHRVHRRDRQAQESPTRRTAARASRCSTRC